jgi:hypothetical protein
MSHGDGTNDSHYTHRFSLTSSLVDVCWFVVDVPLDVAAGLDIGNVLRGDASDAVRVAAGSRPCILRHTMRVKGDASCLGGASSRTCRGLSV